MNTENDVQPGKIARRTLVAGAAWAVPTIAVLSATPAFASSTRPLTVSIVNLRKTLPGDGAQTLAFSLKVVSELATSTTFQYTLSVTGTLGSATLVTSSASASSSAPWESGTLYYPSETTTAKKGTYEFTFSVKAGGETYSAIASITY